MDKPWRCPARSTSTKLFVQTAPPWPTETEYAWNGQLGAQYAVYEPIDEWHVHQYNSTCTVRLRVYSASDVLLGELTVDFSD